MFQKAKSYKNMNDKHLKRESWNMLQKFKNPLDCKIISWKSLPVNTHGKQVTWYLNLHKLNKNVYALGRLQRAQGKMRSQWRSITEEGTELRK